MTVHLAEEVKSTPDDTNKQGLDLVGGSLSGTLSGYQVVQRGKSWERFEGLTAVSESDPDRVKLLVTVEDTGVGIPLEAQSRIFTPFVQADSSTSRFPLIYHFLN